MVGGIERCILGCCGADGQRFFALKTKFAEQPSHRWRPSKATQHVPQPSESSPTGRIHAVDACLVDSRRALLASVDCLLMPAYATPSHEQIESTNRAGPL